MSAALSPVLSDSTPRAEPEPGNGTGTAEREIVVPAHGPASSPAVNGHDRAAFPETPASSEPLARIEDKTSRIEEKLARSEAATQRVVDRFELAVTRMGEMASQSELAAVRGEVSFIARRVRKAPGIGALAATAVAAAVLTAVLMLLVLRYAPGLLPPR